jgi:hypothetical protein
MVMVKAVPLAIFAVPVKYPPAPPPPPPEGSPPPGTPPPPPPAITRYSTGGIPPTAVSPTGNANPIGLVKFKFLFAFRYSMPIIFF